jgi:dTDP-4-dehydrorhamnose reductase
MESGFPILILGASGWLGHYLMPEILRRSPSSTIIAAYGSKPPLLSAERVRPIKLRSTDVHALKSLKARVVVNLTRGEAEEDFAFHQNLIGYCNENGARYVYASSSNAVDADVSKPHPETQEPESQSEYGKFKARCEIALKEQCPNSVVFRFSATHGWAPNRIARTEEFLKKLKEGQAVSAYQGVIQNRTFVGDLATMVATLTLDDRAKGVLHLGTLDASEELLFLRRLARAFGYSENQVIAGENNPWNAFLLTGRWRQIYPEIPLPMEESTIQGVARQPELQQYRSGASI